jgi:methylenetetrahydrofolate dehydrogenase (NADP+)/methenyltetrahydrofolate cyclohydrolase
MTSLNKKIDGKMYAEKLLGEIYPLSKEFFKNFNRKPCLTVIQVGDNPASKIYVKNKGTNVLIKYVTLGTNELDDDIKENIKINTTISDKPT